MNHVIIRGDARNLPLPDGSVDLILTSPPYFGPKWKHDRNPGGGERQPRGYRDDLPVSAPKQWGIPNKSLTGLPWRYAIGCIDQLGLILRSEIIWSKPNGLPESVTDRVRRSHEQVFHFTKQQRYYSAVDEIREPHTMKPQRRPNGRPEDITPRPIPRQAWSMAARDEPSADGNPLGKLPSSVWNIATAPLKPPDSLGIDHFAAYPPELCRRIVLGWSPREICTECGEGRTPVSEYTGEEGRHPGGKKREEKRTYAGLSDASLKYREITGYKCACTPRTSHRGKRGDWKIGREEMSEHRSDDWHQPGNAVPRRPGGFGTKVSPPEMPEWEYHLDQWIPAPTRPGIVLDPFGGTGTTAWSPPFSVAPGSAWTCPWITVAWPPGG